MIISKIEKKDMPDKSKYPFAKMEPGDFFSITFDEKEVKNISNTVRTRAGHFGKENGCKFIVRKIDKQTIGVWRER